MARNEDPYSRNEDHALFLLIKKRDEQAFEMVYRKYHQYLHVIALKYLKDRHMADDAIQCVFSKLWDTTKNIDIEINLKNYLYTMTKNHILNVIRDNKRVVSLHYQNAQAEEIPSDEDFVKKVSDNDLYEFLYKRIEDLPLQKKEVCKRKLETDDSNQEIAEKMGISVNTVKSHYQESLKLLREYFTHLKTLFF